nr:ABC-three component system middle component 6 [uncultured Cohaesibacter sp.]
MPTKHIKTENALIGVGGEVLSMLQGEKTASVLFSELQTWREENELPTLHFDWFLLALDFLYAIGAISFEDGLLRKVLR